MDLPDILTEHVEGSPSLGYPEAKKVADEAGAEIVYSEPNMLLVDIDTPEQYATFQRVLPLVRAYYPIASIRDWHSKSGAGHYHFQIELESPLPFFERLVAQAVLGSDPKREMLSALRPRLEPNREERTCSMLFKPRVTPL